MKSILKFLCFGLVGINALAQHQISGNVVSKENSKAVPFAEIIIYKNDSIFKGTVGDETGKFVIENVRDDDYILKVNYLGFKSFEKSLTVDKNIDNLNIQLITNTEELSEVTIVAEKTSIEFYPDKRVINIGRDLLAEGADVGEILNQIPSVDVDISGNVSLRNDANVVILIDGKRSPLSSADIIAQIPPNLIKSIEVITNPSAKYDAEGASGLINIITKKEKNDGGNLTVSVGAGEDNRHNITLNGNYKWNKINLFGNYNYRKNYSESRMALLRESGLSIINQNSNTIFDDASVNYAKVGIDYYINKKQVISLSGILSKNLHTPTTFTNTVINDLNEGTTSNNMFSIFNMHEHVSNSANLNYRNEFDSKKHYLEIDANYSHFPNIFDLDSELEQEGEPTEFIFNDIRRDNKILTLSADYYKSVNKYTTFEFGLKSELKDLDNIQLVTSSSDTGVEFESEFLYSDRVLAAYSTYQQKFNDLTAKIGLRLEDYSIDFDNSEDFNFKDNYLNLFPSVSLSYEEDKISLSASYSRRISRPSVFALNPFTIVQNEFNVRRGNPLLQPSFTNKFEINANKSFNKKVNLNLSLFYSKTTDNIQSVFISEDDLLVSTFDNVGDSEQYGIELFSKINWTKKFSSNLSFNYYFSEFETAEFSNNTTLFQRYNFNNSLKINKGWTLQLNSQIVPKRKSLQETINGFYVVNFAIAKRLFKNKGQFTLRINDIFRTRQFEFNRTTDLFSERMKNTPLTSRYLYMTYRHSFSFGKNAKERNREKRDYTDGNVD